jgi:hypothetical protein
MEIGELKPDDRVEHGDERTRIQGRVLEVSEDGRRALVRWDVAPEGDKGAWTNVKPLRLIKKPQLITFCAYCLNSLVPTDEIVANTRNGVAIHMRCAREIVTTVAAHDAYMHSGRDADEKLFDPKDRAAFSKELKEPGL